MRNNSQCWSKSSYQKHNNIKEKFTKLVNIKNRYVLVENNSFDLGGNGYNSGSPIVSLKYAFLSKKADWSFHILELSIPPQ